MADSLSVAVKITGDATNLEKSIDDATRAIENQSKKAVKALKDQRDAYGVLRDEQGRIVEGLSKWQRALGYYVDELGTVRTANDRFVDGLTTVQKKIGLEVDSLGNIYNKTGEIVGNTGKQVRDFAAAEGVASDATADLKTALEAAINNALGENVEKLQRDVLSMSGAFQKVKGGFDALFGSSSGISKAVDNIGKLSQSIIGFKQAGESIQQALATVKQFAATLQNVGTTGATAAGAASKGIAGIGTAATGAGASIAGLASSFAGLATGVGLAIAAATILDKLMKKIGGEVVFDPEKQKAIEDYSNQFKTLETRARAAGKEIRNLSDALAVGALNTGVGGTELDQLLADYKKTLQTGISTASRAEIEQETQLLGDTLTEASIRLFGTEKDDIARERAAVFAAINARVREVTEKQKSESDKLLEQIHDLQHVVGMVDDAEQAAQLKATIAQLMDAYDQAKAKEEEAARLETRRAAGLDKYLKAQDAAEVSLDNARAKFAEWFSMAQNGQITFQEYQQAASAAADDLRASVASQVGADFSNVQKKTVEAYNALYKAVMAGVVSQEEAQKAWSDFQRRAAESIASKFGLTLDDDSANDSIEALESEIKKQLEAGAISLKDADALREAYRKRQEAEQKEAAEQAKARLDALKRATGVDQDTSSATGLAKSFEEKQKKWNDALAAGEVTQEQYNAALKQIADQTRAAFENQVADDDAKAKAEREYTNRLKELADLQKQGVIDEKQRQDAEKKAREKRDAAIKGDKQIDPAAANALDALRRQANDLDRQKTWQEELKETLDKVREAHKKGLITQAEMHEAEANYAKIKRQRTKQEEADARRAARDAARSELGIDSIMESMKSPLQKFNETIAKLNDAAGFLSMDEYAAVYQKAIKDFQDASETQVETASSEKGERAKAGASITAGSDTFYKAMIESLSPGNYEATMRDTTKRIYDASVQGNTIAADGNLLLAQIAQSVQGGGFNNFGVFGG